MEPIELTRDQWIERAMGLLSELANHYPTHYEHSNGVLNRVWLLQNARFKEE